MRISDWSSDVCSSDLQTLPNIASKRNMICSVPLCNVSRSRLWAFPLALILCGSWRNVALSDQRQLRSMQRASLPTFPWLTTTDRKSVVEGKSVSVRVDLGGRRIIQKKREEQKEEGKGRSQQEKYK